MSSWLIAIVLAVLLDTAWVALFRARPVGRFKVRRDTPNLFSFDSKHGTFNVDRRSQTLGYQREGRHESVHFSQILGIEYRVSEDHALLEELFFGFDLTDLLSQYRDTVEWFAIVVVVEDGRRVPLFLSGRYSPREFLMSWYIELQASLLQGLGLMIDVEAQSRDALELLRARLGNPRLL